MPIRFDATHMTHLWQGGVKIRTLVAHTNSQKEVGQNTVLGGATFP